MPMLVQQTDASCVVDRDDGGAARVMHDLEVGAMAVGQRHRIDAHADHASVEHGAAGVFHESLRCRAVDAPQPFSGGRNRRRVAAARVPALR
jgi:hypothetical protein